MNMNDKQSQALRTAAIVLAGMTAAMNVLGGVGTSCAAFFTRDWPQLWALYDYRWLYQVLVVTTTLLGIAGVWATIGLSRGKKNALRNILILLVIGTILGGIQMYASLELLGKARPANFKFYINALTLLVFLVYRLPGIRDRVDFSKSADSADRTTAGGLAAIAAACIVLSTASWAGPSHTFQGENAVHLLQTPLNVLGAILALVGLGLLVRVAVRVRTDVRRQESARAGLQLEQEPERSL